MTEQELPPETCSCLAKSHDHEPGECPRKNKTRGGVCGDCNYWWWRHQSAEIAKEK